MPGASPVGRFTRRERVRKRREFEAAQKAGRRVTTSHFVLLLHAREEEAGPLRLGIVASRKVGTAVRRNRAKRLVREAFRATRDLFQPGIDLVVIVRRPLEQMKLADVASEWQSVAAIVSRRIDEARTDRARRAAGGAAGAPGEKTAP
ncbi:MAG TPA: ribonuclease P protein component [Polyangiaceae bacterium]|nr:ribonuclease P protein component [Polyangiaceae bacterium]